MVGNSGYLSEPFFHVKLYIKLGGNDIYLIALSKISKYLAETADCTTLSQIIIEYGGIFHTFKSQRTYRYSYTSSKRLF